MSSKTTNEDETFKCYLKAYDLTNQQLDLLFLCRNQIEAALDKKQPSLTLKMTGALYRDQIIEALKLFIPWYFNKRNVAIYPETRTQAALDQTLIANFTFHYLETGKFPGFNLDNTDPSFTKAVDGFMKIIDQALLENDSKAGDSKAGDSKAGDSKAGDSKAGDSKAGDSKAGDSKAGDSKAGDSKAGGKKKVIVYPEGVALMEYKFPFMYYAVKKALAKRNILALLLDNDDFLLESF